MTTADSSRATPAEAAVADGTREGHPSAPAALSQDYGPVLPERTRTPAAAALGATSTAAPGTSGADFRKRLRAAQSAHNAAKLRGRFKRAAKQPGPGMIRRPPPEGPDAA